MQQAPTSARQPDADAETPWRRVHPLTPVMRSWRTVATLFALAALRSEDVLRRFVEQATGSGQSGSASASWQHPTTRMLLLIGGAAALALVLLLLLNWVSWRATSFRVTAERVEVRHGVLFKQHRNARLDRVQAVDVVQLLIPRMLGLASLSFDVAGSSTSRLRISMLKRTDAEALRESMLARIRAAQHTSDAGASDIDHTGDHPSPGDATAAAPTSHVDEPTRARSSTNRAPRTVGGRLIRILAREGTAIGEDLATTLKSTFAAYGVAPSLNSAGRIVHVPPHRVILAGLLRFSTIFAILWFLFGVGVVITGIVTGNAGAGWSIGFTAFLTSVGIINSTVKNSFRQANFSAELTADGLMITQGITSTERRFIPLDRIQAVGLEQPLLWRPLGWWRAHYNLASHGHSQGLEEGNILIPVGSADAALAMTALALPLTADGEPDAGLTGDILRDAMSRKPAALHRQPRSSRWLDPLSWRVNGWVRTRTLTLIRRGRVKRRVELVPHARVQSFALRVGPLQRRLGLATLSLHSTSGPVDGVLPRVSADESRQVMFDSADAARQARRAESAQAAKRL